MSARVRVNKQMSTNGFTGALNARRRGKRILGAASLLSKNASEKLRKGNYERIFDEARTRVRAWEKAHSSGFTPHAGE
jgi:hypothetical protein